MCCGLVWDTCIPSIDAETWLLAAEKLTVVLFFPRPHVCAEQKLTLVGHRQPCVQAFSRIVPVWRRTGCAQQAWCIGQERRYAAEILT